MSRCLKLYELINCFMKAFKLIEKTEVSKLRPTHLINNSIYLNRSRKSSVNPTAPFFNVSGLQSSCFSRKILSCQRLHSREATYWPRSSPICVLLALKSLRKLHAARRVPRDANKSSLLTAVVPAPCVRTTLEPSAHTNHRSTARRMTERCSAWVMDLQFEESK